MHWVHAMSAEINVLTIPFSAGVRDTDELSRFGHQVTSTDKQKQQGLCNLPDEQQWRIKLTDTTGTSLVNIHIYCILMFSEPS